MGSASAGAGSRRGVDSCNATTATAALLSHLFLGRVERVGRLSCHALAAERVSSSARANIIRQEVIHRAGAEVLAALEEEACNTSISSIRF
jgi:hypothetical protein